MYAISGTLFIITGIWLIVFYDGFYLPTRIFYESWHGAVIISCFLAGLYFYNIEFSKKPKNQKKQETDS